MTSRIGGNQPTFQGQTGSVASPVEPQQAAVSDQTATTPPTPAAPEQAIPQQTAGDFVTSQSGPQTGASPLGVRVDQLTGGAAPAEVYSPAKGSSERQAIMDAMRGPVEASLHQDVKFVVNTLNVGEPWAFYSGMPVQADGQPVNYQGTIYQADVEEGLFDEGMWAFLKKEGDVWKVVERSIGDTDCSWPYLAEQLGIPENVWSHRPAAPAVEVTFPQKGTAVRKALMDALRKPVEADLGKPVIFEVYDVRECGDWAFMRGRPLEADGGEMDYTDTRHQEYIDDGMFDDGIWAIYKKEGDAWKVAQHSIGDTDVAWMYVGEQLGVPEEMWQNP